MRYEPKSQNPQPEPGEDVTRSYQWRFRDVGFIKVWTRWWNARNAWAKAWEHLDFSLGGPDSRYNPDPSLIPDPTQRAAAQEFLDARAAYKADLARRTDA